MIELRTVKREVPRAEISKIGLGCMGMSEFYGPTDDLVSTRVIEAALHLGVTFFDTSDMYGQGHNEELLGAALKTRPDAVVATKFGITRKPGGGYSRGLNNRPDYIVQACEASLRRLNREHIDLYYIHRLDPEVPVEESVGALSRLIEQGKIGGIGLCEVSAETLTRAHKVHPVAALQSEYSLWTRDAERSVLPVCAQLGVTFVAYSPLGRGMLTGKLTSPSHLGSGDFRPTLPRFQPQNFSENYALVGALRQIADDLGWSPAQIALAWILSQPFDIVPIPGTRQEAYLAENLAALEVELRAADLARLDKALPPDAASGERYAREGMKGVQM